MKWSDAEERVFRAMYLYWRGNKTDPTTSEVSAFLGEPALWAHLKMQKLKLLRLVISVGNAPGGKGERMWRLTNHGVRVAEEWLNRERDSI